MHRVIVWSIFSLSLFYMFIMEIINLPKVIEERGGYISTNDILGILTVVCLATFTIWRAVSNWREIKKSEHDGAIATNLGNQKYESGEFKGAISEYDKAIILNPEDIEAYMKRGMSKCQLGDYNGGLDDLNNVIKLYPGYANAYLNRGHIKAKFGYLKEAENDYRYAIELDPNLKRFIK